jgi:hypothetical protein
LLLEECLLSLLVSDAVADEAKNGGTLVGRCCSFFFFFLFLVLLEGKEGFCWFCHCG